MSFFSSKSTAHDCVLVRFEVFQIEFLTEALDERGGLSRAGRPENDKPDAQWETENFVLILIKEGLVSQPHFRYYAASQTFDHVLSCAFLGQLRFKNIEGRLGH